LLVLLRFYLGILRDKFVSFCFTKHISCKYFCWLNKIITLFRYKNSHYFILGFLGTKMFHFVSKNETTKSHINVQKRRANNSFHFTKYAKYIFALFLMQTYGNNHFLGTLFIPYMVRKSRALFSARFAHFARF